MGVIGKPINPKKPPINITNIYNAAAGKSRSPICVNTSTLTTHIKTRTVSDNPKPSQAMTCDGFLTGVMTSMILYD